MRSKVKTVLFLFTLALVLIPLGRTTGLAEPQKGERVPP